MNCWVCGEPMTEKDRVIASSDGLIIAHARHAPSIYPAPTTSANTGDQKPMP